MPLLPPWQEGGDRLESGSAQASLHLLLDTCLLLLVDYRSSWCEEGQHSNFSMRPDTTVHTLLVELQEASGDRADSWQNPPAAVGMVVSLQLSGSHVALLSPSIPPQLAMIASKEGRGGWGDVS